MRAKPVSESGYPELDSLVCGKRVQVSSGVCPVGAGESKVYVPCMLLQIYDSNNPDETLAAEWDNLSDECHNGLKAMYGNAPRKSILANLNRVVASWKSIEKAADAKGINPAILAAVALKESGGVGGKLQLCEQGVTWGDKTCSGAGMFQIDLYKHQDVSKEQALDVSFAALYAAQMLKDNMTTLESRYPAFTGDVLLQATFAAYNSGIGNIHGNPDKIDTGTTGNNYGANVLQLVQCF